MADVENLKVAVRVRPFNSREKDRAAKNIVEMKGNVTTLQNPQDKEDKKDFTYDYSYWSFDGFTENNDGYFEPVKSNSPPFCDQQLIYNDLGKGILDNAWKGYNSTLFAYGQTGSGKSWSVIGYGPNKGIVPMICENLFGEIATKSDGKTEFEVQFSMLEIYNEVVRDLLNVTKAKGGLKIREHPKKGFYADGLKNAMVTSYADISAKMEEGTVNRTIASTNMNATSSRAHTIVGIRFVQKYKNNAGEETAKQATLNLVDLAGSERVESTGATGSRLKEGAAINLSLTSLGNCIHALAEKSEGKKARVPYRDSSLTKLLMNALGGNSKTIMIAAISPADINYDETLSTLRYADRAKQIKTKATVNEDPTEKLLRELKEENDRLKQALATGAVNFQDLDKNGISDDIDALRKQWEEETKASMKANEQEFLELKRTYEEKLKLAQTDVSSQSINQIEEDKKKNPHFSNLNVDPQLSGRIVHIIKTGNTLIGSLDAPDNITMKGPMIQKEHGTLTRSNKRKVILKPMNEECRILVNGSPITSESELNHNDRVVIGSTQFWVFQDPRAKKQKSSLPAITYEYAQEEIAAKSGINIKSTGADMYGLQEELLEVMPAIEEANSISAELDRRVKFEMLLTNPQLMGEESGKSKIQVKMKNFENGTEFVWSKEKFLDRLYLMKEMYQKYEEEEDDWDMDEEKNPFTESLDTEVHIGTANIILHPLAYNIEIKEQLQVVGYKNQEAGMMNVEVVPCSEKGKEFTEEDDKFVDNPEELVGKDMHFLFKILSCRGISRKYLNVYCTFALYLDKTPHQTKKVSSTANPDFKYQKQFDFTPVTKQFVDYLQTATLPVKVMGQQRIRNSAIPKDVANLSTKDLIKSDKEIFSKTANLMNGFHMDGRIVDPQKQSIIVELLLLKKTQTKLQQRVDAVRKLVKEAENISRLKVSVDLVKEVLNASTPEQADIAIKKIAGESDNDPDVGVRLYSGGYPSSTSSVCTLL